MRLVEILPVEMSITDVQVDCIILKNVAEGLFGPEEAVDRVTNELLRHYYHSDLTQVGKVKLLRHVEGIAADSVILVGVGSGSEIGYDTISLMHSNAIAELAESSSSTRTIASCNHAVGFGLDGTAVFQTILAALKSSLEKYHDELDISTVVFSYINPLSVRRTKAVLEELAHQPDSSIVQVKDGYYLHLGEPSNVIDAIERRAREEKHIFVAMPFSPEFENVYDFGIRLPIEENGLLPIRTDKRYFPGSIVQEIKKRILASVVVISDITGASANVMFELGFAQGCDKPTIIICEEGQRVPFDVAGMNIVFYKPHLIRELKYAVSDALRTVVEQL